MGIERIINLINQIRNKPGLDKAIIASYFNPEVADGVERLLLQQAYSEGVDMTQTNPFLPEPEEDISGPLRIGKMMHSKREFGIMPNGHTLIVGQTGSGKTTIVKNILKWSIHNKMPFIDFDSRKDHYPIANEFTSVKIIKVMEDFRINPLRIPSPHVPEKVWLSRVCMIMAGAFGFFIGSKDFLIPNVFEMYQILKESSSETVPNLLDLREFLRRKEKQLENRFGPNRDYISRNINRLDAIITTNREMFDVDTGFDIEKLSSSYIIMDIDGLDSDLQRFLINLILYSIIYHRMYSNQRGKLAKPIRVIVDEARRFFPKQAWSRHIDFDDIGFLLSQSREFGIAFVIAEQIPHMLSVECIAESKYKIILNISNGADLKLIKEACSFNIHHIEGISSLPIGNAVVKISDSPYPFAVEVDPYNLTSYPNLERLNKTSRDFISFLMKDVVKADHSHLKKHFQNEKAEKERELEELEKDFMKHIARKPLLSMTQRYEEFGVSRSKGDRIVDILERKGLVKRVEIITGERGGKPKLLELTEDGIKFIHQKLGIKTNHLNKGIEHYFWQNQIKDLFYKNEGVKATFEAVIKNTRIDVLLQINNEMVAVEIAMTPQYELENIKKDLSAGCKYVIVVLKNWIGVGTIKKELQRLKIDHKVIFILAREFTKRKEWILSELRKNSE